MGKFKLIEEKLTQITSYLIQDNDLVKLLANVEVVDNNTRKGLINNNIYKYAYVPKAQEETKAIICCFVDDIVTNKNNPQFFDGILVIDVMVHKDTINTDIGDRLLNLCDIVDKKIENNNSLAIGGADFGRVKFWQPNKEYLAYNMPYRLINWKK